MTRATFHPPTESVTPKACMERRGSETHGTSELLGPTEQTLLYEGVNNDNTTAEPANYLMS